MNFKKRTPRQAGSMNMSSTADIAFLLLIFFLVTTTIFYDSGIPVKLPQWTEAHPEPMPVRTRNIFRVLVNANNELLVNNEIADVRNLKEDAKEFILNPKKLETLSVSPKHAIISLQNDRGTNYETYFNVYNELKAAYNEIWDEAALKKFGFKYKDLSYDDKKEIRNDYPLVISEAEPTDFLAIEE